MDDTKIIAFILLVVDLAIIYVTVRDFKKPIQHTNCSYCLQPNEPYAPCGIDACKDCCSKCFTKKEHCRYIESCLDGQELD